MVVTAAWRVVLAVWGVVAHGMVAGGPYARASLVHHGWPATPLTYLVDAGVRMDGFWYATIAKHGYNFNTHHPSSIVFFPLFPLLIKILAPALGNVYVAGVVIPTIALFLSVWALQVWLDARGAGEKSALTTALILCYPFGFFWASMYTESLFLLLALTTFILFERGRWELAAACAFLAVLCRPTGLILAPCLALMLILQSPPQWLSMRAAMTRSRRLSLPALPFERSKSGVRPWLAVAAGPLAYVCFMAYQWAQFGTPLAMIEADRVPPFRRDLSQGLSDLLLRQPGFPPWYLAALLVIGLVFLVAVPFVYRRFGAPYALFAALVVLFPMSTGLVSLERYVMVDFPAFAVLACVRKPMIPVTVAVFGFYALLGFMTMFIAGYTLI